MSCKKLSMFIQWLKAKGFNPCELVITALITSIVIIWGLSSYFTYEGLGINGLGDFFAGIFTPIAFYWLIRGYMLQKQELQQNTEMLKFQAEELKNTVGEYKQMVEINKKQLMLLTDPKLKTKILSRGPIVINAGVTYLIDRLQLKI